MISKKKFDSGLCISCKACVLACRNVHYGKNRISLVQIDSNQSMPNFCRNCANPLCVAVCPVQSLSISEKGNIYKDETRCIDCRNCVIACPFGVVSVDNCLHICDFCENVPGNTPVCVATCPTKAVYLVSQEKVKNAI